MLAVGALKTWTWWPHLANFRLDALIVVFVILFLEYGHTGRERERGGGGGIRDWTEFTAGVNFAFSSMPNDMHAEERQARLERE